MAEIDRFDGPSGGIELDLVEREATPQRLMELSIHLRAAGLSLADTVSVLESFGVDRCRSTVHNWMQKANLQPTDGKNPDQVALDETVIRLNDQRFWLVAAVAPGTNEFLLVTLQTACTMVPTKRFLQ